MLVTVKEWLKSVLSYRSYPKNETGYPFFGPLCTKFIWRQTWKWRSIIPTGYVIKGTWRNCCRYILSSY